MENISLFCQAIARATTWKDEMNPELPMRRWSAQKIYAFDFTLLDRWRVSNNNSTKTDGEKA